MAEGGASPMEKISSASAGMDRDLGEIAWLRDLEERTMIPKMLIALVGAIVSFVTLYVTIGPALLCNLVGFVYPAYASFKAIETEEKEDDTQWLTYWVVYAVFNLLESFVDIVLFWFPFYFSFKLGFLVWLFLPNIRGAEYLYKFLLLPVFLRQEQKIDETLERVQEVIGGDDDDEGDDEDPEFEDKKEK